MGEPTSRLSQCPVTARPLNEEPDWLIGGGWQRTDEDHPPGGGEPAYRAVYKTLRVVLPTVELRWPNLLVRFGHGTVDRGGMTLPGAIPARRPHHWVLPESGRLVPDEDNPDMLRYDPDINMGFNFAAEQEEIAEVFFLEFILKTEADGAAEQLGEGRWKLATIRVMLDLRFGTRLLGAPLVEEAGRVFEDWHFIRSLESERVGAESQLAVAAVQPEEFDSWSGTEMDRYMRMSEGEKGRLGLACDWYWTGLQAADPVTQFLHFWFAVEVVAMPDTANVAPLRERLSQVAGAPADDWREFVGRLVGLRDRLVHGNERRTVPTERLVQVRALVEALLDAEFGQASEDRRAALRRLAGI